MTSAQPAQANSQNAGRCGCLSHQAPSAAVTSGRMPVTTDACTASTRTTASPMNNGKPNTTPTAVSASARHCMALGHGARTASRYSAARAPATAARPKATNHGDSWGAAALPLASRVIGMRQREQRDTEQPQPDSRAAGAPRRRCRARDERATGGCAGAVHRTQSRHIVGTDSVHFAAQIAHLYR